MRRLVSAFALVLIAAPTPAREDEESVSVAAAGDVVVHNVDRGELVGRFREVDRLLEANEPGKAGAALADVLLGDLPLLVEEREGVYLRAAEAALLRTAVLPEEGLAAYRRVVDPHAAGALAEALETGSLRILRRAAERMVMSTPGPRICVSYADRLLARGELRRAAGALEDLLGYWRPAPDAGVTRADVLSRLAGVLAALGDTAGILQLADTASADVLAAPSPAFPGRTLGDEFAAAVAVAAESHAPGGQRSLPEAPATDLRVAGELRIAAPGGAALPGREVLDRPVPLSTPGGPLLVTRILSPLGMRNRNRRAALMGLGPPTRTEATDVPPLAIRWQWPLGAEQRERVERDDPQFTPAVADGLLLVPWPRRRGERLQADAVHSLLLMDVTGDRQPRILDERGVQEAARSDGDLELQRLSFVGRPAVVGDAVYACLVGRSEESGATELHVARYDLVRRGSGRLLRARWRVHVLDGSGVPDATYSPDSEPDAKLPLVEPTGPLERHGRIYVGSNSGAIACLDGASGSVLWLETYPRRMASPRMTLRPARATSWHEVPLRADGRFVMAAPRDADGFGRFAAMPRSGRSTLVDWTRVRDLGTAGEAGSIFHYLVTDQIVAVNDGWVYCAGSVPREDVDPLAPTETPLVALRQRPARAGEPARQLLRAQIPDYFAAGDAALARDAILLGTGKAIYRVALDDFEGEPKALFRAPDAHPAEDRIGNLVPAGPRWLWSVTADRIVLFAAE